MAVPGAAPRERGRLGWSQPENTSGRVQVPSARRIGEFTQSGDGPEPPAAAHFHLRVKSNGSRCGGRLLLVEDHDSTRVVLQKLLSQLGYEVVAVATVRDAIAAAERQRFDAIVSDLGLPDGSGYEVMLAAKQVQPEIHGLAVTAGLSEDADGAAQAAGFDLLLRKPVHYPDLRLAVQTLAPQPVRSR